MTTILRLRMNKELLSTNVQFSGNNIDLEGSKMTKKELIDEMKVINDQKYEV